MQRQQLLEEFNAFCQVCVGENVQPYQRRDLRRAFMAGASAMYRVLINDMMSRTVITPGDIDKIKDVQQEINTFSKDLREGRA